LIDVAVRLGLPDLLGDGALTAPGIAATRSRPGRQQIAGGFGRRRPRPLLRGGRLPADSEAYLLRSEVPGGLRTAASTCDAQWWPNAYGHLDGVSTATTGFALAFDQPMCEWLAGNPDAAAGFNANMATMTGRDTAAVLGCGFPLQRAVAHLVELGETAVNSAGNSAPPYRRSNATIIDRPMLVTSCRSVTPRHASG
jgi:hypothetical protein